MIQLILTVKITTAQVVETSVTVNNSSLKGYVHSDDHTQPTYEMNPGFKAFTKGKRFIVYPILSTNTLKKCKKIGLDNWNLDISPLFCFCVFVVVFLFMHKAVLGYRIWRFHV